MVRAIDLWRELCKKYEQPDNLPTWEEAGKWTEDKLYFWKKYIDITTGAMVGNRSFPNGVVYVDLFGGTGICSLKNKSKRRFPGSAIIAAHAKKPFSKIIICEKNPLFAEACKSRLQKSGTQSIIEIVIGDCNSLIYNIIDKIPEKTLTLAFVDPKGLDCEFNTIKALANSRRTDFVVLFADAYDINRNYEHIYRPDPNSKLDKVLGPENDWRPRLDALTNPNHVTRRKLFADIYKSQLKKYLGYECPDEKVMTCNRLPLYRLVYASKNKLGWKFWRDAVKEDSSGQRSLFD
ncbi:MAG: three-Cys-motif partner protein TcmP [Thermoguttaceae bacterium]|jgi:three-Cys-motif partner protein